MGQGCERRGICTLEMYAARSDEIPVSARQGERIRFLLNRPHLGARCLQSDGERDGTRSRTQIDHARLSTLTHDSPGLVDGETGENFGLGTHDEHAGHRLKRERTEEHATGDVLERYTQGPLPHPGAQFFGLLLVQPGGERPLGRGIARPLQQLANVRVDGFNPGGAQALTSPGSGLVQGPFAHVASRHDCAAAAKRSASSASCSEAITASSAPDRTASRLCALKPVR